MSPTGNQDSKQVLNCDKEIKVKTQVSDRSSWSVNRPTVHLIMLTKKSLLSHKKILGNFKTCKLTIVISIA